MPVAVVDRGLPPYETHMIMAQYDAEGPAMAINTQRTRYAILSEAELAMCSQTNIGYCCVTSPLYSTSLTSTCMINLYLQNTDRIQKFCHKNVIPNAQLPMARYVVNGFWLVTCNKTCEVSCNLS